MHAATLASATVNMNRAARKFLADPGISRTTNGQFFLTGYSEGGYATLATQRLMQQSLPAEFPVTASEPGAGPYDMTGTTLTILSSPTPVAAGLCRIFFQGLRFDLQHAEPAHALFFRDLREHREYSF